MIALPRPGSLGWRVLQAILEQPGELDVAALALRLEPAPALDLPPASAGHAARTRAYAAWLEAELGPLGPDGRRRGGRRDQASARVSRLLGRLQELGLIETRGAPLLAPWWLAKAQKRGFHQALAWAHPAGLDCPPPLIGHLAMVREVEKGPPSARALLGPDPSGARKRTYADLVAWGVIIPPAHRWATEAGRALIERGAPPLALPQQQRAA